MNRSRQPWALERPAASRPGSGRSFSKSLLCKPWAIANRYPHSAERGAAALLGTHPAVSGGERARTPQRYSIGTTIDRQGIFALGREKFRQAETQKNFAKRAVTPRISLTGETKRNSKRSAEYAA